MRMRGLGQDEIAPGAYAAAGGATGGLDPVSNPSVDTRPWYIKARDWLADSAVVNAATALRDYTVDETRAVVQQLYNVGLDFQNTFAELKALQSDAAQDPDLQEQYNNLVSRGNVISSTISSAVRASQGVAQWVKDNVGVDLGVVTPGQLQGLGFVQLVPAAIIGAAVAAVALATAWIVDARSAIGRIQALRDAGLTPDQISAALKQQGGLTGAVSSVSGLVLVAGLVAAGIYFAPELKKLLRGSRGNG